MNKIRLLAKKQPTKLIRFAITGIGSTLIHVCIASGLIAWLGASQQFGNGTAFVVATLFSYTVNTLWSFSDKVGTRNAVRFVVVSFLGLALTLTISLVAESFDLHYMLGIAMIVTTIPICTFMMHSVWTYRQ